MRHDGSEEESKDFLVEEGALSSEQPLCAVKEKQKSVGPQRGLCSACREQNAELVCLQLV